MTKISLYKGKKHTQNQKTKNKKQHGKGERKKNIKKKKNDISMMTHHRQFVKATKDVKKAEGVAKGSNVVERQKPPPPDFPTSATIKLNK